MTSNNYIAEMREIAAFHDVSDICTEVLDNPDFAVWTASSHKNTHHYGDGGLVKHTYEVLKLCLTNRETLAAFGDSIVNSRVLACAAIYHDIGKLTDYRRKSHVGVFGDVIEPGVWESAPDKYLTYHISRSAISWAKAIEKYPRHRSIEDDVLHAILAHHGRREWGSPVEPRTRAAWILHLSDQMSARINDCDTLHSKR
jgi:3'-5' exoribonuclease